MAADPRNQRRKENYAALRAAGFSPSEADRIKGARQDIVEHAIRTKQLPEVNPVKQAASKGLSKAEAGITKTKVQSWEQSFRQWRGQGPAVGARPRVQYVNVLETEGVPNFLSRYSYTMSFWTVDAEGNRVQKIITITSDTELNKADLVEEVRNDILPRNAQKYKGSKVLVSTIQREKAFYNPKPGTRRKEKE